MHKDIAEFLNKAVPASQACTEDKEIGDSPVYIDAAALLESCRALKTDSKWDFKVLQVVTGIDYPEQNAIEVSYMLSNFFKGHELNLKVKLPRDNPRVESVCELWSSANFQERETADMLGVVFENHPDPRRLLCPDDWEGFPLRKDYVAAKTYKHMEIYPEDKMNIPERAFDEKMKAAFKEGKSEERPEVQLKRDLIGQ